ncbi:MAG: guanylate kinase [Lachnospiraceae bacterium]|jgi:guanylate kinase|nr:guanylate kinase [Lachnospiraceae bacterium]MCI6408874.1 guanylate kinase [Lachnospiraceae bacterium]MCI6666221.1 guanylate kinase [Lachnospiraceae bacterium]MCI6978009.1 guanylate kinase [Lachnospiraceae bacterium]MDD6581031.1 guanylate kinase [Lachnospiraceae bacterium]
MGKIFYILGKSSTGKDTIYKNILEDETLGLKDIILYTTRPIRDGETDGKSYHFVSEKEYEDIKKSGLIIEERSYNTMHGVWRYFTVKDSSIDLSNNNYVIIGVLKSFIDTRDYFGSDKVVPIYIEVEDGLRLQRALNREKKPENRRFKELCRRYLADSEDFSEDKIKDAGIDKRFENVDLSSCINEVKEYIRKNR